MTGDMRFFGIGDYDADSGAPLRTFTIDSDGRLVNVSGDYPRHIERDAAKWWQQFQNPKHGPYLGAIASWAADECSLGRQSLARDELDQLQREHRFSRFTVLRHGHFHHTSYARFLENRLHAWGYATQPAW
jgi:hypothetical protein